MWLGIFGGILMVLLMGRKFRGAVVAGILFVTFISWIPGHSATYLGADSQIPGGAVRPAGRVGSGRAGGAPGLACMHACVHTNALRPTPAAAAVPAFASPLLASSCLGGSRVCVLGWTPPDALMRYDAVQCGTILHACMHAQARREYFLKGVSVPDISATAVAWDWKDFGKPQLWAALISFLYLDFLDTTGTLFSMATFINKKLPGFIDPQ